MKRGAQNGEFMKIKCPFCKNIYDPEACDSTCPACNKKLMVSVFKKKPEGKPGAGPATTIRPPSVPPTPPPSSVAQPLPTLPPPPPPVPTPVPPPPSAPVTEFVAPKAPIVSPLIKESDRSGLTQKVTEAHIVTTPAPKVNKVVVPTVAPVASVTVPPPVSAPTTLTPPVARPVAPPAEKKTASHGATKTGLDLVISLQQGTGDEWDAVIRIPVQIFKLANLVPARAREAIESEGIDFEELRKAVEHAEHVGPLLDIQTQTQRVHIAIEPHG